MKKFSSVITVKHLTKMDLSKKTSFVKMVTILIRKALLIFYRVGTNCCQFWQSQTFLVKWHPTQSQRGSAYHQAQIKENYPCTIATRENSGSHLATREAKIDNRTLDANLLVKGLYMVVGQQEKWKEKVKTMT